MQSRQTIHLNHPGAAAWSLDDIEHAARTLGAERRHLVIDVNWACGDQGPDITVCVSVVQ